MYISGRGLTSKNFT